MSAYKPQVRPTGYGEPTLASNAANLAVFPGWALSLGAAGVAIALIAVFLVTSRSGDDSPQVAQPSTNSAASGPTSASNDRGGPQGPQEGVEDESTPSETPLSDDDEGQNAIDTLDQIVADDRAQDPIRDQWVAQLASKYEGVVDESQQPEPFTAAAILAEVQGLRNDPNFGSYVRVVHQGDWARSTAGPRTLWVTFVDLDAGSREEVVEWCEGHFDQRGEALLNVCYPRQMHRK